jgi:hypothetical protein
MYIISSEEDVFVVNRDGTGVDSINLDFKPFFVFTQLYLAVIESGEEWGDYIMMFDEIASRLVGSRR